MEFKEKKFKVGDIVKADFTIYEVQRIPTTTSPYYFVFPFNGTWRVEDAEQYCRLSEELFEIPFKEKALIKFIKQYN